MSYFHKSAGIALSIFLQLTSFASADEISLPPLPYEKDALAPYISSKTLELHYGKHHQGYVEKINGLLKEKNITGKSLEEIIKLSSQNDSLKDLFNGAAQVWNHTFYWNSMKKGGGGEPSGKLKDRIIHQFGSLENFRKEFIDTGTKVFGSGWVWLVLEGDKLVIVPTSNADLPLIHNQKPLLACDVWEHAYYLDYQNRRKDYVTVFLDNLVNWDFAAENLEKAEGKS